MGNNTSSIVSKVWSFCNPLRDVGVGYGDYLEQLTYLLFLKMADEYSKPPYNRQLNIPKLYNWESLTSKKYRTAPERPVKAAEFTLCWPEDVIFMKFASEDSATA